MHVSRSQAQRALGFRFRGFGDVAGGRSLGDKIAVLEGLSDAPCCSTCARGKLAGFGGLGIFADDNVVQTVSTNVFSGGAALFALGLVAFFISSRKKRAT